MKKVLLFADIGGHEYQKYYHVGDEAMFYETYRWYKQNHPDWKLSVLSWFPTHQALDIHEVPHLHWAKKRSSLYFPLLIAKLICLRVSGISFFSPQELAVVKTIKEQDRVHFSGGGNLSSQFRQWLYYAFFVLITAKFYGKEILLTSQTIGPIAGADRFFAFFALNLPQLIAIRAKTTPKIEFKRYGAFLPEIRGMLDAAYTLPVSDSGLDIEDRKHTIIGLSVHAWKGWEEQGILFVRELLMALSKTEDLTVVLIPHHLTTNEEGTDITYMKKIVSALPKNIRAHIPSFSTILASKSVPETFIKKLTSQVDLLITTRYHGIIFALSKNVPTIALQFDEYYRMKNGGALEMFYGTDESRYQVGVKDKAVFEQLTQKTRAILENLTKEKATLKSINDKVSKSENTLNSVMIKFETAQ